MRGRRGLDCVKRLQTTSGAVTIDGTDYADIDAVDAKLVRFAKDTGAQIISTDYTLDKVAQFRASRCSERQRPRQLGQACRPAGRGDRSRRPA